MGAKYYGQITGFDELGPLAVGETTLRTDHCDHRAMVEEGRSRSTGPVSQPSGPGPGPPGELA
jgi:hypothetical protein